MSDEFDDAPDPRLGEAVRRRLPAVASAQPGPAELVARLYADAAQPLKARLLDFLLRPVGALGLAAVLPDAFASLLARGPRQGLGVSVDDVVRVSSEQVLELARYVEQCSPDALQQIGAMLADSPAGMAGLGSAVLVLALRSWYRRGG